jgi:hypothetical protein
MISGGRVSFGSGTILNRTIEAIEIEATVGDRTNNLVFWQNRYGYANRDHHVLLEATTSPKLRREIEGLLFAFYRGEADAGYGADTALRTNITALGLSYVAGIMPQTSVWAPGTGPQPPKSWSGYGRPPKLLRRDGKHQPTSVKKLAFDLPSNAWRKITWREATAEPLSSHFARVRVRAAHRDYWLAEGCTENPFNFRRFNTSKFNDFCTLTDGTPIPAFPGPGATPLQ